MNDTFYRSDGVENLNIETQKLCGHNKSIRKQIPKLSNNNENRSEKKNNLEG